MHTTSFWPKWKASKLPDNKNEVFPKKLSLSNQSTKQEHLCLLYINKEYTKEKHKKRIDENNIAEVVFPYE